MAPLTAYHRTPLPPTGVSHALICKLFQTKTRSTTHLITARDTTLSIWEITVRPPLFTILPQFKLIGKGMVSQDRISHLRTHKLHGTITSLSLVRTLQSKQDGQDRVLVSFEQAKISLMEWSIEEFDLIPVSLHTFEKLPQVVRPFLHSSQHL